MIIGLSGYARSGKDAVADVLVREYGFERVAFADPIRNILYALNPTVDGEGLSSIVDNYGWDIAKSKEEVRVFLQALGYAARVHIYKDIWIMAAFSKMVEDKNYVITDVRFQNEAEVIQNHKGHIWRVQRPGVEPVNTHVSEWEMDNYNFDNILVNDGNLEQLEFLVKKTYDKTV
jgi:hypothetical protein